MENRWLRFFFTRDSKSAPRDRFCPRPVGTLSALATSRSVG
jgi:hypothetical protein